MVSKYFTYILEILLCSFYIENIKTETFDKNNFLTDIFEKNKDLCNEGPNLYELYTSPLIEQFNNR